MTLSKAASTAGIGLKALAGIRWSRSKVHHGVHAAERSVVGGTAARLRATCHWTTMSAWMSLPEGSSNMWRINAVVDPKGSDPNTLNDRLGNR